MTIFHVILSERAERVNRRTWLALSIEVTRFFALLRMTFKSQRGYTLVELVVLMGILAVLAGLLIANTGVGNRRQQVRDAAFGYVNAARQAEALAASGQAIGGTPRKAYGVCITSSRIAGSRCAPVTNPGPGGPNPQYPDTYQVYARNVLDMTYTSPPSQDPSRLPTIIDTFRTEPTAKTGSTPQVTFTSTSTYLDYLPPGPTLKVNGLPDTVSPGCPPLTRVTVSTTGYTRRVAIRACAGAVYVE